MGKRRRRRQRRRKEWRKKDEIKKQRRNERGERSSSKATRPHEDRSAKAYEIKETSTSTVNIRRFVAWMIFLTNILVTWQRDCNIMAMTEKWIAPTKLVSRQTFSTKKVRKPYGWVKRYSKYFEYVRIHLNFQSIGTDTLDNVWSVKQTEKKITFTSYIPATLFFISRILYVYSMLVFIAITFPPPPSPSMRQSTISHYSMELIFL